MCSYSQSVVVKGKARSDLLSQISPYYLLTSATPSLRYYDEGGFLECSRPPTPPDFSPAHIQSPVLQAPSPGLQLCRALPFCLAALHPLSPVPREVVCSSPALLGLPNSPTFYGISKLRCYLRYASLKVTNFKGYWGTKCGVLYLPFSQPEAFPLTLSSLFPVGSIHLFFKGLLSLSWVNQW